MDRSDVHIIEYGRARSQRHYPPFLLMAIIGISSGILSGLTIPIDTFAASVWLPGTIYSVLVMLPFSTRVDNWGIRAVVVAVIGTAAFHLAMRVQAIGGDNDPLRYILATFCAGLGGASILGGTIMLALRLWKVRGVYPWIVLVGGFAGAVFGTLPYIPDMGFWLLRFILAYVIWQTSIALLVGLAWRRLPHGDGA